MGVMGTHQVFDSVNDLGQAIGIEAVTRRNGVVGVVGFRPSRTGVSTAGRASAIRASLTAGS